MGKEKGSQKKTEDITVVFKSWVDAAGALEVMKRVGLSNFPRRRTSKKKNGLLSYIISAPPARANELRERANNQREVVSRGR